MPPKRHDFPRPCVQCSGCQEVFHPKPNRKFCSDRCKSRTREKSRIYTRDYKELYARRKHRVDREAERKRSREYFVRQREKNLARMLVSKRKTAIESAQMETQTGLNRVTA